MKVRSKKLVKVNAQFTAATRNRLRVLAKDHGSSVQGVISYAVDYWLKEFEFARPGDLDDDLPRNGHLKASK